MASDPSEYRVDISLVVIYNGGQTIISITKCFDLPQKRRSYMNPSVVLSMFNEAEYKGDATFRIPKQDEPGILV
jgi:hypothetical protein